MPEGGQFHGSWLADKSAPLPGTRLHPQGRLFNPSGSFKGDPWKLAPENWMKQSDTPAHSDTITWHSTEESSLPRSDEYEGRQMDPSMFEGADWDNTEYNAETDEYNEDYIDYSVDSKDRPMAGYGSAVGMHFGDFGAAQARSRRGYVHPARIPSETLVDPPRGNFATPVPGGQMRAGTHRSSHIVQNAVTGEEVPDKRWSDSAANYSEKATDAVEKGKTIAYRNDVEAAGSTSYRALPETVRTWSEDVMSSKKTSGTGVAGKYGWHADEHAFRGTPHPALVHLAEKGYDPVVMNRDEPAGRTQAVQLSLFHTETGWTHPGVVENRARQTEFERGKMWRMQKPAD